MTVIAASTVAAGGTRGRAEVRDSSGVVLVGDQNVYRERSSPQSISIEPIPRIRFNVNNLKRKQTQQSERSSVPLIPDIDHVVIMQRITGLIFAHHLD